MVDSFTSFLSQYSEFNRTIQEYVTTYQYALAQQNAKANSDRTSLLSELQVIENEDRRQKIQLQNRVAEQLNTLHRLLYTVDQHERGITEKRFRKYKDGYEEGPQESDDHYTQREINSQVTTAIKSIEKITKSRMPKSVAAICGFFNRSFRKDVYQQIVENRLELERMISVAERDVQAVASQLQQEIVTSTAARVAQLQTKKNQLDSNRTASNEVFMNQLKQLLLDGLERVFCADTIYSIAHKQLSTYLSSYTSGNEENLDSPDSFFVGLVSQNVNVSDDGTLDAFLTTILPDGVYSNGNLLLPIALKRYFSRPICVNYFAEYNSRVYELFSNYASQMMNLFLRNGVTTHLVDCTNMGGKYAEFTSYESNDENKRVHVVRTTDELKTLLNDLSEYIIETNSSYLKNNYLNVEQYNSESAIKRELHVLFISNLSEIASGELLEKLTSIVRNGNRCGVFTFVGVSTDECQVSGLISQTRVNEVNTLIELCDTVHMSSTGDLSFGNSMPHFFAPPAMNNNTVQTIIRNSVQSKGALTLVPLGEHTIARESFFSETCYDSIKIPVGVDAQGNEYTINLNKEAAYMLIGGNPSCGKSSLIHTIILQCITRYSPENLVLYVADLKDGSEFDTYVHKGVKSVKVVLDDSESDISASFLNFIKSNVEMRLEQFGQLGQLSGEIVRNIEQFYEVNNAQHLVEHIPRMLVIIDEFQSLYNSSRVTGEITNWLVRMCRTVGIYIIMASQRAQGDASSVANSFGSQTKEYFIYRAMFKLPYSGAREIMSENCSDTNRENPALRRAQTLKNGQIIINPNMGATEEDNQIVQCYYPDNDTISSLCDTVVEAQGAEKGIILNSEATVQMDMSRYTDQPHYIMGESNRLYYDSCNKNTDAFGDDNVVSLNASIARQLIACGTDSRVMGSCFWALLIKQVALHNRNIRVCILANSSALAWLQIPGGLQDKFCITESADEFSAEIKKCRARNVFVYAVVLNPYAYEDLQKDDFSSASDTVQELMECWKDKNVFMLFLADSMKKIKDDCSYIEAEIPYRIISVGNIASIRSAMTFDAGDKLTDSPFNTVRPNVIKAYYYNKATDKLGRFRMYQIEQLIQCVDFDAIAYSDEGTGSDSDSGYSGLFGN